MVSPNFEKKWRNIPTVLKGKVLFVFCTQTDGRVVWTPLLPFWYLCEQGTKWTLWDGIVGPDPASSLIYDWWWLHVRPLWQKPIHCLSKNQTIIWRPQRISNYKINPYIIMHYGYNVVVSFTVSLYLWPVCFGGSRFIDFSTLTQQKE